MEGGNKRIVQGKRKHETHAKQGKNNQNETTEEADEEHDVEDY